MAIFLDFIHFIFFVVSHEDLMWKLEKEVPISYSIHSKIYDI
jgi:hypothetical protein